MSPEQKKLNLKYIIPLICTLIGAVATIFSTAISKYPFQKELPTVQTQIIQTAKEKEVIKIIKEIRQNPIQLKEVSANTNLSLTAEDKAYLGAICDGVRKVTEYLSGTHIQSDNFKIGLVAIPNG